MNDDVKTVVVGVLSDEKYGKMHDISRRVYSTDGIAPCIHCCGGGVFDWNYPESKTRRGRVQDNGNICPTITAEGRELYKVEDIYSKALNRVPKDCRVRIRKLTPKECWRLMAFDDDDFDKAEQVNSNTQLYKQAGNSIVVSVLEAIFKEML